MRGWLAIAALAIGLLSALPGAIHAQQANDEIPPEQQTGNVGQLLESLSPAARQALAAKAQERPAVSDGWMVVAANPLAVEAGAAILAEGGSAADAMIAVQAVLGLVEPQSSGLGGGAFLLWHDGESGQTTTLDAREIAPAAITPSLFLNDQGEPMEFYDAVVGGRSVGVPGVPALMEEAHRRWGRANWDRLFQPAIGLAENGFTVSPRLASLVEGDRDRLSRFPETAAYFLPNGQPIAQGDRLANPAYAHTLRNLARNGAGSFYRGMTARHIVGAVQSAAGNPGTLSLDDMAAYQVIERPPVCAPYRDTQICGMGPPSSGGLSVGEILGLINASGRNLAELGPTNPQSWRLIGEASRLAFADRGRYIADSDFLPVPTAGLLSSDYLASRAGLLAGEGVLETVEPGTPPFDHAHLDLGDDESIELPSTSQITIVDRAGNVLSMTSSIENAFGSRLFVDGFLLNNQLTDFSFRTHEDTRPIANRAEPRKRPRSSMAPTIVLRNGRPIIALGSPGGSQIIGYVAQAVIAMLDWNMNPQQAAAMAHRGNRFGPFDLEADRPDDGLADALGALGYEVNRVPMTSGLHIIGIDENGKLSGGADPRREGIAIGG